MISILVQSANGTVLASAEHPEEVLNSTVNECTPESELLSRKIYFYGRKEGQLICVRP